MKTWEDVDVEMTKSPRVRIRPKPGDGKRYTREVLDKRAKIKKRKAMMKQRREEKGW